MLSVIAKYTHTRTHTQTIKRKTKKKHEETLASVGYAHYLDCGDGTIYFAYV